MARLNLVLLLAVLVSALYLVHTQYQSRRLFTRAGPRGGRSAPPGHGAPAAAGEKRAQATPLRVERMAPQLNMRTATPAITQYVSDPAGLRQQLPAPRPNLAAEGAR